MRDLIAWLPRPSPIITFQRVYNFLHLRFELDSRLMRRFHQFAGQKVASTKAKIGIRQDILGIIVGFAWF